MVNLLYEEEDHQCHHEEGNQLGEECTVREYRALLDGLAVDLRVSMLRSIYQYAIGTDIVCAGVVREGQVLIHEAVRADVVEFAGIHDPLAEDRCAVYEVHVADAPVGDGTVREEVAGVVDVPGIGMEDPGVWPLFVFTPLLVAAVDESFFIVSSSIS